MKIYLAKHLYASDYEKDLVKDILAFAAREDAVKQISEWAKEDLEKQKSIIDYYRKDGNQKEIDEINEDSYQELDQYSFRTIAGAMEGTITEMVVKGEEYE